MILDDGYLESRTVDLDGAFQIEETHTMYDYSEDSDLEEIEDESEDEPFIDDSSE